MSETAILDKSVTIRDTVAKKINSIRTWERKEEHYEVNRGIEDYFTEAKGLAAFFDYLRTVKGSNLVVDIGAGTTKAISEIANGPIGRGLDFKATVLDKKPQTDLYLGRDKTITTSAEVLRGIQKESVAGVLAIISIAYSVAPELVTKRIDEILVPSGAIKAAFTDGELGYQIAGKFICHWKELGYDVARNKGVVLAIKPGEGTKITAKEILEKDNWNMKHSYF
jgi:hypothetical protein